MVAIVNDSRQQPQVLETERAPTAVADGFQQESFPSRRILIEQTNETNVNTKQPESATRSAAAPTGAAAGPDADRGVGGPGVINESIPGNSFWGNVREGLRWVAIAVTAVADGFAHRMAPRDYMSAYPFLYDGDPARGQNILTMIRKGQWNEALNFMKNGSEVPDEELLKIQRLVRSGNIDEARELLESYRASRGVA